MATADEPAGDSEHGDRPDFAVPGACDTHIHLFGPQHEFPYAADRRYTPPDATVDAYRALAPCLGIGRAVLSAPSIYGTDNRALLHGLAVAPDMFRGVVMVPPAVTDDVLKTYHDAGVRGVRTQLKPGGGKPLEASELRALAMRVAPLGWHAEIHADVGLVTDIDRLCADFPVPVVIEHMGHMHVGRGVNAPGFQALLRLLRNGGWVKLSGPYINSSQPPPHDDVLPFVHALLETAPDRVVWGTNWPHPHQGAVPDDRLLAQLILRWIEDPDLLRNVLATNPARLYGFSPAGNDNERIVRP